MCAAHVALMALEKLEEYLQQIHPKRVKGTNLKRTHFFFCRRTGPMQLQRWHGRSKKWMTTTTPSRRKVTSVRHNASPTLRPLTGEGLYFEGIIALFEPIPLHAFEIQPIPSELPGSNVRRNVGVTKAYKIDAVAES